MEADLMEEEQPVEDEAAAPAETPAAPAGPTMPPEARAAAQKLMAAAMRIVYKKEVTQMILQTIQRAQRPEIGVAQGVLLVLKQVKDAAKGVPPKVIYSMARPVAMMIIELA